MRARSKGFGSRLRGARHSVLAFALVVATGLAAQIANRPLTPPPPDVIQQLGLVVPMRDGIRLAADLYLPRTGGRFGTILIRTPYNRKSGALGTYQFFTHRGYAVVLEDVRGRYGSQGVFGSTEQEGPDSSDTMNWIAAQPWSNGRIGMAGSSYLGMVQWWAAVQDNPHLVTISPMCSGDDEYLDRFYSPGGALKLGHRLLWLAQNLTPPSKVRPVFTGYIWHLPERTDDIAAMGVTLPLWRVALDHPSYDSYWKPYSLREQLKRVAIPILSLGGWFDNYAESDLDAFSQLSKRHDPIETWIGPWAHNPGLKFPTRDFGPQAAVPIRLKQAEWFDHWMRGEAPEPDEAVAPLLHIFVMGPNAWREEQEWPLARTHYTPLYLASKGHANSNAGDGALSWAPVRKSQSDTFIYDPKNPVPTTGGAICCDPRLLPPGPLDQTPVETRDDVLVYTSPPLTEDLEVTGPVRALLYVATSANDTDFTAKLIDLEPTGRPLLVTDGIQRLRYRLSLEKPVFVKRNTAYRISIDAGVTSYVFAARHRIRLEVSSSNFPRFDRNPNSARPIADEVKIVKAKQTVYHDKGYPSALILPVIPAKSQVDRTNK
jgi:putative CocE/NonD family hydrolase